MSFDQVLKEMMSKVEGAQAAILMGFDGIPIAEVRSEGKKSIQDIVVEFSRVLSESLKISLGNDLGPLQDLSVATEKGRWLFRPVGDNYFLGLLLSDDAHMGKGRFVLRRSAPAIQAEL